MPAQIFYVGSRDKNDNRNGYVPSRFYAIRGHPVVDPMPGGSQAAFIYLEASDRYRTDGKIANPNNYLIVPDKFSEQRPGITPTGFLKLKRSPTSAPVWRKRGWV